MTKREKAIIGLEHCLAGGCHDGCPYHDDIETSCADCWADAIELLKAQKARLMRAEDFENNPDVDDDGFLPCWVECNEAERARGVELGIIAPGGTLDGWTEACVYDMPGRKNHNPNVRHWTSRPTKEQMKEAKWE